MISYGIQAESLETINEYNNYIGINIHTKAMLCLASSTMTGEGSSGEEIHWSFARSAGDIMTCKHLAKNSSAQYVEMD